MEHELPPRDQRPVLREVQTPLALQPPPWPQPPAPRVTHAFATARGDGRAGAAIDVTRPWRERAVIALAPDPFADLLLGAADRLVACTDSRWLLIDVPGARVVRGALRTDGAPSLDLDGRMLYAPAEAGTLEGIDLGTGVLRLVLKPRFGQAYRRSYVEARDGALVVASVRMPGPHGGAPIDADAVLERLVIDQPPVVGAQGIAKARRTALFDVSPEPLVAGSAVRLVCARRGLLDWFDGSLQVLSSFAGEFIPRAICLADDEHALMVVDLPAGPPELWAVDAGGGVRRIAALPFGRVVQPPVVTGAARVYLAGEGAIIAVDPASGIVWQRPCADLRSVLAVGPDALLVVAGPRLQVLRGDQTVTILYEGDRPIRSNPVPLASGEIAVATEGRLRLLEPVPPGAA